VGEPRRIQKLADGSMVLDAMISLSDLADVLDFKKEEDLPYDTVAGLILDLLGRFPEQGEKVKFDGFVLICEEVTRTAILKVRILKDETVESDTES
jgi:putative hemolysin